MDVSVGIVAYCTHNPVDAQVHEVYAADAADRPSESNVYAMILRGNMDYATVTLVDHDRACRSTPGHRIVDDRFELFVDDDETAAEHETAERETGHETAERETGHETAERVPREHGRWVIVPHRSYRLLMRGADRTGRVVMRLDAERGRHRIYVRR